MIQELMHVGFSEKEAKIYILLVQKGELSAVKISSELNYHRRTVYDILDSLFHRGYILRKKVENKEIFSAIEAEVIAKEAYEHYLDFKKILPKLQAKEQEELKVNIISGTMAIKILVEKLLPEKGELLVMGKGGYTIEQLGDSIYQYYGKLQEVNWRMIQTKGYTNTKFKPKQLRYYPEELETGFIVFSNMVYLFPKEKDLRLIEITNMPFANTFRIYFESMWKHLK